jgi:hypothetical protein
MTTSPLKPKAGLNGPPACGGGRTELFRQRLHWIHRTLRVTPAMAAGVTDRLWNVNDLVALWESYEQRRAEGAA